LISFASENTHLKKGGFLMKVIDEGKCMTLIIDAEVRIRRDAL